MWECFLVALRLGLTSFGGPVAHIGFMREAYVTQKKWVSEERFGELMSLCQFLPGPGSSQLGAAIGYERAKLNGALAAWLGFTLPSALLMIAAALGFTAFAESSDWMPGLLRALKLVAIAVVAHAWLGMRQSLSPDLPRVLLAVAAMAVLWFLPHPLATLGVIVVGAMVGVVLFQGATPAKSNQTLTKRSSFGVIWLLVFAVLLALTYWPGEKNAMQGLGGIYQAGSLVFGGGHVVLPMLETHMVTGGWMERETFLGGYGAAQALPGPLFAFAAYLGAQCSFLGNPWVGGVAALVAVFLPGMLLLAGASAIWGRLREKPWAQNAVKGANAAVVGVLGVALLRMATSGTVDGWQDVIAIVAVFALLIWGKLPVWLVVIAGGIGGALFW